MALTASLRIKLLKEISQRLASEDWQLIDVTLNQFSLPTQESWQSTRDAYVLEMAKSAPDHTLIELGQHVGFDFDEPPKSNVQPSFWRNRMFKLFVSHLSANKAFAADMPEQLYRYGISAFVAHNDIEPTLEWQVQIETALSTSDALVALLNQGFHASNWTDQEIGFAMGRGLPVFAVRYEEDPYGFVGKLQAFQGSGKSAALLARELFDAYRTNKQSQQRMTEVLLNLFEDSGSFAEAKTRIGYLEQLPSLHHSYAMRIQTAEECNSQISGSWGVSDRVAVLAKKWTRAGA